MDTAPARSWESPPSGAWTSEIRGCAAVCRFFADNLSNTAPPTLPRENKHPQQWDVRLAGSHPKCEFSLETGTASEPVPLPDTLNEHVVGAQGSLHRPWAPCPHLTARTLLSKGSAFTAGAGRGVCNPCRPPTLHLCGSAQVNRDSTATRGAPRPFPAYPRAFFSHPPTVAKRNLSFVLSVLSGI